MKNLSSFFVLLIPTASIALIVLPIFKIIKLVKLYNFFAKKLYFGFFIGFFMKSYLNLGISYGLIVRKFYQAKLNDDE